ncbi:putative carboxylesterase family protein [Venturia nashicola]|uniref:Carboxylic ester hydrolase n=1 Tax=Venturia nashicola TaxID=86259 RepID=A0A4Z1P9A4_9PEZI|nr:putative carboxylesterase family protein [Venturia nashicola]
MASSIKFTSWLIVLPVLVAAWLNYPALQQSLQQWMGVAVASPVVTLPQGRLTGKYMIGGSWPNPVESFMGIPYALPPVGHLRFANPVPVGNSSKTFEVTEFGPRCPGKQLLKIPGGRAAESEDCLTANVFRPKGVNETSKLPVGVYMHGGAFNRGTSKMHDSASMVGWSNEPFIIVSFNYRLGALGFLNSALTKREGLLNVGLKDQVLLMEWVQENVAKFGGDPGNVTLFGLSAGAHSIGHHVANINSGKTLFHKVAIESGGITSRAVHSYDSQLHKTQFRELAAEVSCNNCPDSELLACLRAVSFDDIVEAQATVFAKYNPSVRWAWQPVIDNDIISRRPLDTWKSGNWHKVPILTGSNHNEGTMYVPTNMSKPQEFKEFFATLLPQLSEQEVEVLATLYPDPSEDPTSPYLETRDAPLGSQFKRVEAAYGHYAYVCPVRQNAIYGSASPADPPIFLYHWAQNRSVIAGANHGDQMWYETMDPAVRAVSPTQADLAGWFHGYVTSFIITGDPNAVKGRYPDRPEWKAFADGGKTMVFGLGNDEPAGGNSVGTKAQFTKDTWAEKECKFWWEQSANPED